MAGAGLRSQTFRLCPRTLGSTLAGLLLAACGSKSGEELGVVTPGPGPGPGPGATGTLVIELTDAPFEHLAVAQAKLVIQSLELHADPTAQTGFQRVFEGPLEVDLAALCNGRTLRLATVELPADTYRLARLTLLDAELVLDGGERFAGGEDDLDLSAPALAGQRIYLARPVELRADEQATLLLDFDLTRTFVPDPVGDPHHARKFFVHPVVRGVDLAGCGTLRGQLAEPGALGDVPLGDATVYLMPTGFTGIPRSISGTASDPDGGYAFLGVPPGVYDLWVMKNGREHTSVGHVVSAGTSVVDVLCD